MKLRIIKKLAKRGDTRARKLLDRRCARFLRKHCSRWFSQPRPKAKPPTRDEIIELARRIYETQGYKVERVEVDGLNARVYCRLEAKIERIVLTTEV